MLTADRIAELRSDFYEFHKYMFEARKGVPIIETQHQRGVALALERVVLGLCKRLIINIPPRSGKTDLAVISFIAWCMGNWQHSQFIHASYSKRLATTNVYAVRAIMQHEKYEAIFGAGLMQGDSQAKDEFRTTSGGLVYATGAEGTITGYGAGSMIDTFGGAIVIDDPHKAGEANSAVMRQNVIDWFSTTMESRKNSPDTPIIIVMQRLHENDLSGFLLNGGNGEEWEHLKISAVTESGESFWPAQFPLEMLNRLRDTNSYVYAGQYLQEPAPLGGGIFKDEWLKYWHALPNFEYRMIYADTAMKTGEQNDYSVFQHWGKGADGKIYLLDMIRGKWEAPQLLQQAKAFWIKCKGSRSGILRKLKVEDKASGTGLIQQLRQDGIPVEGIPRNTDKVTRGYDAAPQVEAGNVYFKADCEHLSDMMHELALFPNASNDDTVDPFMDAVQDMLNSNKKTYTLSNL